MMNKVRVMKMKAKKTRIVRRKVKIKKVIKIKIMRKMVHQRVRMKAIKSLYRSNPQI
mgnify:CR=1 FL=1